MGRIYGQPKSKYLVLHCHCWNSIGIWNLDSDLSIYFVRYIYWNAHFFGENFYGWSVGDKQSLSESGPFHSQGRIGAGNQPWQGSWRGKLVTQTK